MPEKTIPAFSFVILTPLYDLACMLMGYHQPLKKRVAAACNIQAGEHLLDIGCGTATLLLLLKKQYPTAHLTGIDPDKKILAIAQQKMSRQHITDLELIQGNAATLPFAASTFDVVTSSLAFHHMQSDTKKKAIQEIYRVLKPHGRFLLADFGPLTTLFPKLLLSSAYFLHIEEWDLLQDNLSGTIPQFLTEAGFTVQETQPPYRGIRFWLATKQ